MWHTSPRIWAYMGPLPRALVKAALALLEERPSVALPAACSVCWWSPGAPDTFPQAQMSRTSHFPCKYLCGWKPNI